MCSRARVYFSGISSSLRTRIWGSPSSAEGVSVSFILIDDQDRFLMAGEVRSENCSRSFPGEARGTERERERVGREGACIKKSFLIYKHSFTELKAGGKLLTERRARDATRHISSTEEERSASSRCVTTAENDGIAIGHGLLSNFQH